MLINTLLIGTKTAKTDKEYKVILEGKIKLWYLLGLIGVITIIIGSILEVGVYNYQSSFFGGIYVGFGVGLLLAVIRKIIVIKKILKSDVKIRQTRLKMQDERRIMIAQKALVMTATILIVFLYIGMMVVGFMANRMMFWAIWSIIMMFFLVYIIVRLYYEKKL